MHVPFIYSGPSLASQAARKLTYHIHHNFRIVYNKYTILEEEKLMNCLFNVLMGTLINVGSHISVITTAGITFTGEITELLSPAAPVSPPAQPAPAPDYQVILLKLTSPVSTYTLNQVIAIPASQLVSIG
jgi:hypothetical protein